MRALEDARKDVASRRANTDKATAAYENFLRGVAIPLFRQAATVLKAEGQPFTAQTPAGSVRLVSDHGAHDFLELELDTAGGQPQVIGRTSQMRGRQGQVVEERALTSGKAIEDLTEDDVSQFLIAEIRKFVTRP